jgi:hypothetical protein
MTAAGSVPRTGHHAAVSRGAVEVQQHCPGFRLDDGYRDVVPGETADRIGGFPECVRGLSVLRAVAPVSKQEARLGNLAAD